MPIFAAKSRPYECRLRYIKSYINMALILCFLQLLAQKYDFSEKLVAERQTLYFFLPTFCGDLKKKISSTTGR